MFIEPSLPGRSRLLGSRGSSQESSPDDPTEGLRLSDMGKDFDFVSDEAAEAQESLNGEQVPSAIRRQRQEGPGDGASEPEVSPGRNGKLSRAIQKLRRVHGKD